MAVVVYPGSGLGVISRPRLAFTLGSYPIGSFLTPVYVISEEPATRVRSYQTTEATSRESEHRVSSDQETWVVSDVGGESVRSELPPDTVESQLPPDEITSEEPDD